MKLLIFTWDIHLQSPTKYSDGLNQLTKTVAAAGQKEHDSILIYEGLFLCPSVIHFHSKWAHFSNTGGPHARVCAPLLAPAAASICQPTLEGADMILPGFHADLGVVSPAAFPFCLKWSNMNAHKVCTEKSQRETDRGCMCASAGLTSAEKKEHTPADGAFTPSGWQELGS